MSGSGIPKLGHIRYHFQLFLNGQPILARVYVARTDWDAMKRWCESNAVQELSNGLPYKLVIDSAPEQ